MCYKKNEKKNGSIKNITQQYKIFSIMEFHTDELLNVLCKLKRSESQSETLQKVNTKELQQKFKLKEIKRELS